MPTWLPVALTFSASVISSVLLYRGTSQVRKDAKAAAREAKAKASKDDVREAFNQAKGLYQDGINEAQRRIESCNRRISELEDDLEAARVREKGLRQRVSRLEDALRRAGLAVPNGQGDLL